MKYSIVIPTYNHCDDLLKPCIESIIQYSNMSEVELIISANGCTDNTRSYLDNLQIQFKELGLYHNLKIVWNINPLGYAKATNEGIKVATTDKIILFNNDALLLGQDTDTWLDLLAAPFLKNPKCGITCVIEGPSAPAGGTFAIFFCVMIDRKVFDAIGLLNEAYGVGGGEDTEFSIEAKAAGFETCLALDIQYSTDAMTYVGQFPIYHKGEGTMHDTSLVPDYNKVTHENSIRLAKKYNPAWLIANAPEHASIIKYSIVLPTYNHCEDLLKPCIDSLITYTDLSQIEIIVIANGCTDNTYEYVTELTQQYSASQTFKLIWVDDAIGYTCATNIGINAAQGEYIILLSNDVEILPSTKNQWLDMLAAPFSDKSTAVAGPLQLRDPDVRSNFIVFFCAMIPRKIFDAIGILDEIFNPGYGEDIDFSMRAKLAGYKIALVGEIPGPDNGLTTMPIWHKNNKTFGEMPEYGATIVPRNQKILKDRYANKSAPSNDGTVIDRISLQNQHLDTYNQIFQNNEYGVEESEIRGKIVIDIGANLGMFSLRCIELGAKHVYSIEAQPTIYQSNLIKNVGKYSSITPLNYAAFSHDGQIVNIPNDHAMSQLSTIGEPVSTITLKKLLTDHTIEGNDLVLKLDCEGSEFDILMTADLKLLRRFSVLYMELHGDINLNPKYLDVNIIRNQLTMNNFKQVRSLQYFGYPGEIPLNVFVEKWVRE